MMYHKTASRLGDYLIINGVSGSSLALTGGKAGIGLTLFELARKLDDERIGDYAFNIINEVIAHKNKSMSIMEGEMCVGYTLLYVENEGLMDVGFDRVFGPRHEQIVDYFEQQIKKNETNALLPNDLWYFVEYCATYLSNTQCRELLGQLIDIVLANMAKYASNGEINPILATVFFDQLAFIIRRFEADNKSLTVMKSIEENLLRFRVAKNLKDPFRTVAGHFVSLVKDSIVDVNDSGKSLEKLITGTPMPGFSNSYKVMLVLLEWLYVENPSDNMAQLRSILGVF